MKQSILKKVISAILTVAMLLSSVQLTVITVLAEETDNNTQTAPEEKKLTLSESIEKEMAERSPITKDRSAISQASQAAVYVDGKLYKQGDFSSMWNAAMDVAAYVNPGEGQSNHGRYETVEYVLNWNMLYDKTWFGEKTMTISNKYFTIDLNGHVLRRTDEGGSVIRILDNSVVTIMDSDPDRVNAGDLKKNNLWAFSHATSAGKNLKGGVITGGYHSTSDGGGLYVSGHSTVYLTGGTIAGNKADLGSGVYLEDGSTLDMSRGTSQICYNYAAGTTSDGGAVFLRSDCSVIGGYIHNNLADDYGGGIRAKGGNISITNVVVYDNDAREYGGGIYVERTGTKQIVTISGCRIVENYAPDGGGGIYLWDLFRTNVVDCLIEENTAEKNGAGICVSCFMGTDVAVSGKTIIRNNSELGTGEKVNSNLYLAGDDDLIVDSLSLGSEIWIKTGIEASSYNGIENTLLDQPTSTSHLFFKSDVEGYCIKYQDDPAKENYRHLYIATGTRTEDDIKTLEDYSTKILSTPYKVESGANKDATFPLYKGYTEYDLMSTTDFFSASPFYYSDGYFFEDPEMYNKHLATMSINLAVSAFGRSTNFVGNNTYANHFANVKQLLSDIGCADSNFYVNADYQMKPAYYGEEGRLSTIGVAISQKKIELNGEAYTLVPVAIRGASYESEWSSNVSIGTTGEAKGFSDAAEQVYKHIKFYVENYGLTEELASGKIKFWVVGYSRAGATANLTSKRLVDNHADEGNQIFGYTFEAPMGGVASEKLEKEHTGNGTYPTIHNTINEVDFVTLVAPSDMGFIRYGVDHLIGSDYQNGDPISYKTTSKYYTQRMQMIAQLNAINPYFKFYDGWEVADVNIILGNLPIFATDIVDKGEQWWDDPNPECQNIYTFLRWFFHMVIGDGLMLLDHPNGSYTEEDARKYYSEFKPLASISGNNKNDDGTAFLHRNLGYSNMSVEQAAASLVSLFMGGLGDEQMDALINAIMTNAGILKESHTTIHKWDQSLFNKLFDNTPIALTPINALVSVLAPFIRDLSHIIKLYNELINNWDERSEYDKSRSINWLMHELLDGNSINNTSVWDILTPEQAETVANALPVVLWFVLNYASKDYNDTADDDGMWGVGTFINNAGFIISNHYQEISMAWVRSYDKYYDNDLQAYRIDPAKVKQTAPDGRYVNATNTLTLSGQEGASIFYSVDGGKSWSLYTKPVSIDKDTRSVLSFSICRGAKSDVTEILTNPWAGTILGHGNVWFLIIGSAIIVAVGIVIVESGRKKKKITINK